eukprot:3903553-Rhodomonas_salina.1
MNSDAQRGPPDVKREPDTDELVGSQEPNRSREDTGEDAKGSVERQVKVQKTADGEEIRWEVLMGQAGLDELDNLLFTRDDYISRGSALHREFTEFLEKYAVFRGKELKAAAEKAESEDVKRPQNPQTLPPPSVRDILSSIPKAYDQRYRFNFAILPKAPAPAKPRVLREAELKEARRALVMFEDFRQRRSLVKVRKMREAQRALPIYKFKDEIVRSVREHQVVLVAGDTGCGKSTQVPQYLINGGFSNV